MKVVQKQPVLIAEVEMMPAEDDTSPKVGSLALHHLSSQACLALHVHMCKWVLLLYLQYPLIFPTLML